MGSNDTQNIDFLTKMETEEEEKAEDNQFIEQTSRMLTFCVEGNISVGKSTFLQRIAALLGDLVEVVSEPTKKWRDLEPGHHNILDAFYTEPQKYAYVFQNYVFLTRVLQEKESASGTKPLRLIERSVFSDRMVFAPTVYEKKWMNELEINVFNSWFDLLISCLPDLTPDGFIYLRASPDTCYERMLLRGRAEEGNITLSYLQSLHEKHEKWLFPLHKRNPTSLAVKHQPLHKDNLLHSDVLEHVFQLGREQLPFSIHKVPVLVLDCDPDLDFNKDMEAEKRYARLVLDFFKWVKKQKGPSSAETSAVNESGN